MKVAILYVCTGLYSKFFDGFYKSAQKFLLVDFEKHYFVWTDNDHLADGLNNVTIVHREFGGFPMDCVFRYEMFLQVEDQLREYDYVYFFNSNSEIRRPIDSEILPDETGLAIGVWPKKNRYNMLPAFYPYERNRKSLAYVAPFGSDYTYFMGGLNGGTVEEYLKMIRTLSSNTRDDYNRGIIAKVYDESHINAYLRKHPCKKLGREFCLPEEWIREGDNPKNVFRNKVLIDPYFNKGRKSNFTARFMKGCNMIWNAFRWYLCI